MPPKQQADETLDQGVIETFRQIDAPGSPDFLLSLIDLFIEEAASQIEVLRSAGQRLDVGVLKATAHSLKGSSMTMGAKRLARLCERMEGSAGDAAVTSDLLTEFDCEFVNVRSALNAERPGGSRA